MLPPEDFLRYVFIYWVVARVQTTPKSEYRKIFSEYTTRLLKKFWDARAQLESAAGDSDEDAPGYDQSRHALAYRRIALTKFFGVEKDELKDFDIYRGSPFTRNLDRFVTDKKNETYREWRDAGTFRTSDLDDAVIKGLKEMIGVVPPEVNFAGVVFAGGTERVTRVGVRQPYELRDAIAEILPGEAPKPGAPVEPVLVGLSWDARAALLDREVSPPLSVEPRLFRFPSMQAPRVLVSGGAQLDATLVPLATELGRQIASATEYHIITGGLRGFRSAPSAAVDFAVAEGAEAVLRERRIDPSTRIFTMLPQSDQSDRERFAAGRVIRIQHSGTKSRRYAMVLSSDAVVSISGRDGTQELIALAWIAGKPVLPIPSTGGASQAAWAEYREEIIGSFRIGSAETAILETSKDARVIAQLVVKLLKQRLRPRCFIALQPDAVRPHVIETFRTVVDRAGFAPIIVTDATYIEPTTEAIWDALRGADIVIADLTGNDPSVFFQLGIAKALGKRTILAVYSPTGELPMMPLEVRVEHVLPYGSPSTLRSVLEAHLPSP